MRYFKNSDLVKLYNISDKSIRNWIEATQSGKLHLELHNVNNKAFIADTLGNLSILDELVEKSRKYRNKRSLKILKPSQEFYQVYGHEEILKIITSLDIDREYPQQYRYVGGGGEHWDSYLHKLNTTGSSNTLKTTRRLIELNLSHIDELCKNYSLVNIIDVGAGNGLAAKDLISHFNNQHKLNDYIALDVSEVLLKKTQNNIDHWFNGSVKTSLYKRDILVQNFMSAYMHKGDVDQPMNIILFLGGTLTNFEQPSRALQNIRDGMQRDDLLLTSLKLDSSNSRRFFDFNTEWSGTTLPPHNKYVLDLLNIKEEYYEIEHYYDQEVKARFIKIRLRLSLILCFDSRHIKKEINFNKGDSITLWKAHHFKDKELFQLYKDNGLSLIVSSKSSNEEFILTLSKVSSTTN